MLIWYYSIEPLYKICTCTNSDRFWIYSLIQRTASLDDPSALMMKPPHSPTHFFGASSTVHGIIHIVHPFYEAKTLELQMIHNNTLFQRIWGNQLSLHRFPLLLFLQTVVRNRDLWWASPWQKGLAVLRSEKIQCVVWSPGSLLLVIALG